jgi:uncharacterized phage protein gp47/JayE
MTTTVRTITEICSDLKIYQQNRHSGLRAYEPTSVLSAINEAVAHIAQDVEIKIQNVEINMDIYRATGEHLDYLIKDRLPGGRLPGTHAYGQISFYSDVPAVRDYIIPKGTIAYAYSVNGTLSFETTEEATLEIGEQIVTVDAQCIATGIAGNINAYAISTMPSPPPGVSRATNTLPFAAGEERESDDALRKRYFYAVFVPGRATKVMVEQHVEALEDVYAAKVFSVAPGQIEMIIDAVEETPMPLDIEGAIEENIAVGVVARGCLSAKVAAGTPQLYLGTSRGGKIWIRADSTINTGTETITYTYDDHLGRSRTGHVHTSDIFIEGEWVEATLQDEADLATQITGITYSGSGSFSFLIGRGIYPYLYNLPERITVDVTIVVRFAETPEANLNQKIYNSIFYLLDNLQIGETLYYSDLERAIYVNSETQVAFTGIAELKACSAMGNSVLLDDLSEKLEVENDERLDPGLISITIVEE